MARTEARVRTAIWRDPDFLSLTGDAQRAYLFLLSQPDLTHVGVLPLRARRWAGHARGSSIEAWDEAVAELEAARFVLVDRETEELLVRTLFRNDEVYRQPNLVRSARKALADVASPVLRAALAVEIGRCVGLAGANTKDLLQAMLEDIAAYRANPSANPSPAPLGEGGVVTAVTTDSPFPPTHRSAPPDPRPKPSVAEQVVLDATDATAEEARALVALVKREAKPDRLVGMLRRMAKDGDIAEWLARVRAPTDAPRCAKHEYEFASNCRTCASDLKGRE